MYRLRKSSEIVVEYIYTDDYTENETWDSFLRRLYWIDENPLRIYLGIPARRRVNFELQTYLFQLIRVKYKADSFQLIDFRLRYFESNNPAACIAEVYTWIDFLSTTDNNCHTVFWGSHLYQRAESLTTQRA